MESDGQKFRSGFVVLWGKPNVGKSTLLNALIGQKAAIVSPKPQTTRHRTVGVLNVTGAQLVFLDTPGIHKPRHKLGEALVETAGYVLSDADVVVFVVDGAKPPNEADERSAKLLQTTKMPVMLVLNKLDLIRFEREKKMFDTFLKLGRFDDFLGVSALHKKNLNWLVQKLVQLLPEGSQYYPTEMITDQSQWRTIAELIREQTLLALHQEVPHSVAVVVEEVSERKESLVYAAANIYVENNSQKKIVVGVKGGKLREIGTLSRKSIETYLGKKVYLDLWVKVKKNWRMDKLWVNRFGYAPPK